MAATRLQDKGKIEATPVGSNCSVARPLRLRTGRCSAKSRKTVGKEELAMAGTVEKKLAALGIALSRPAAPVANYLPFVRSGNMLFVSGQLCFGPDGKLAATGRLGESVSLEDGQKAARACAINILTQVKAAIGDLDRIVRVIRLGGFINSAPGYADGPKVMNGASDLMVEALGDKGRHARSTVGVTALPADATVEIEGQFEVM
jgi:enamine deaminase RidA (YjgF/YER057c/UK114 family)